MPLSMKKTEVQFTYTASNLMAELGGFLGLYIGASLLYTGIGQHKYCAAYTVHPEKKKQTEPEPSHLA